MTADHHTPESLNALRTDVVDWTTRARKALRLFEVPNGLYLRDSEHSLSSEDPALTTTFRTYTCLTAVDRCIGTDDDHWVNRFREFVNYIEERGVAHSEGMWRLGSETLNRFDLAHLADVAFVDSYLDRYRSDGSHAPISFCDNVPDYLVDALKEQLASPRSSPEMPMERGEQHSAHLFVTLHALRALAILGQEERVRDTAVFEPLLAGARRICIEQVFYSDRGIRHRQDPFRLVFATVIYCLYADQIDRDLCQAAIEAIHAAQQPSGSFPATHPILRGRNRTPWPIASHEVALCLTWLYFQPRLPDPSRILLLDAMERYFRGWIIPTFASVQRGERRLDGWYDDHSLAGDTVMVWATSVVCHFLANYHAVLTDWINRRVIETLGLEQQAERFLIDESAHRSAARWASRSTSDPNKQWGANWPDLPPTAWGRGPSVAELTRTLRDQWSDPTGGTAAAGLAETVLHEVVSSPQGFPGKEHAGVLPGPPGTGKTTLVRAVAAILDWTYVPVPAEVILDKGFDLMEAQGSLVFRRLNYLHRCVIFFDEFEEFFRIRRLQPTDPGVGTEETVLNTVAEGTADHRTIAAFTTPAMLPRLQALHDQNKSVFFFATNDLKRVDEAVIRLGRFDFKIDLQHPTARVAASYLDSPARRTREKVDEIVGRSEYSAVAEVVKTALLELPEAEHTRVPFAMVNEALMEVARRHKGKGDSTTLMEGARQSLEGRGDNGLPDLGQQR